MIQKQANLRMCCCRTRQEEVCDGHCNAVALLFDSFSLIPCMNETTTLVVQTDYFSQLHLIP